jgi:hypothetical protein
MPNVVSAAGPLTQLVGGMNQLAPAEEWLESLPTFKASDSSGKLRKTAAYPDPFFRHLTVLPTLNTTLYEALVTSFLSCSNPLDYVRTEANHVNDIVHELWTLTQNDDIHHASFVGVDMIYRVRRDCELPLQTT